MSKPPAPRKVVVATNRRARHDYTVLDEVECGIVLQGSEVKSLRESKVQLADAYARIERGEAWLLGLHIAPYSHASAVFGHQPERRRKLLLHRRQIDHLSARIDQEGLTLVPLSLYFSDGRAKVEIGLARGKKTHDKRQDIARRDADREAARAIAASNRRR